jgi:hypothetical protein
MATVIQFPSGNTVRQFVPAITQEETKRQRIIEASRRCVAAVNVVERSYSRLINEFYRRAPKECPMPKFACSVPGYEGLSVKQARARILSLVPNCGPAEGAVVAAMKAHEKAYRSWRKARAAFEASFNLSAAYQTMNDAHTDDYRRCYNNLLTVGMTHQEIRSL